MQEPQTQPPQLSSASIPPRKFAWIVALSAPWLALLAYLAYISRFFVDDAFISFRYARNLLEGHGLVWNPGERVEGYSNFLWVLKLAAIWAVTGVPPEDAAWWLSVAYTAATLGAMAWWAWRLPGLRERGLVWWMALALLCSSATFALWTSGGGLETRQFTFFVLLAVVALTAHRGSRRGLAVASLSLALASLTRPEGPLIAACCFAWWAAQEAASAGVKPRDGGGVKAWALGVVRRMDWRGALWLALPFALIVGAHFLWRYSYYGEWLPNTYYAKFVRPWWDVGLRYLGAAALETGLYLLLPLAAWGAWARWRERRDLAYGLPLLIIAPHAAHIARVGGDIFQWRPLDFYWPLLALPAADTLARAGTGVSRLLRRWKVGARFAPVRLWAIALFLPVLFYAGAMQGALFREFFRAQAMFYIQLDSEKTHPWVLVAPGMPALIALSNKLHEPLLPALSGKPVRLRNWRWLHRWRPYEDMERGFIPDDAVASIESAGVVPYYLSDLTFIDVYGLNDWVVARNPVARPNSERRIFRDRFPPPGYLDSRGVNFEVRDAERDAWSAIISASYAAEVSPGVWMPFNAPSLEWVEERFDSFSTEGDLYAALDAQVRDNGRLAAASHFEIYDVAASDSAISDGRRMLVYVKEPCAEEDASAQFFLRLVPMDEADLPEERMRHGFDNLDFAFADRGRRTGERCVALRHLPDYPVAAVRTGQSGDSGEGVVWSAAFSLQPGALSSAYETVASREPPARGAFDVHLSDGRLVYVKEDCALTDADARFFLHVVPERAGDLPEGRREVGFDNLDFDFFLRGALLDGKCVASVALPDYPVAAVRTGQSGDSGEGVVWSAAFSLQPGALSSAYETVASREPPARGAFDVHLSDGRLVYVKEDCALTDADARFFLHVVPERAGDLPEGRREVGFDNLDFDFFLRGALLDGKCVASVALPDYPVAGVRTGQSAGGEGELWGVEIAMEGVDPRR